MSFAWVTTNPSHQKIYRWIAWTAPGLCLLVQIFGVHSHPEPAAVAIEFGLLAIAPLCASKVSKPWFDFYVQAWITSRVVVLTAMLLIVVVAAPVALFLLAVYSLLTLH
jgi:hypothetical protein